MGGLMAIRKASPVRAWRADPGLAQNAVPVFRASASASARQHRTRGTGAPQHSASGRAVITRGVPADSTRAISRASPTPPTGERRLCPLAHGTASNSARGPIAAKFGLAGGAISHRGTIWTLGATARQPALWLLPRVRGRSAMLPNAEPIPGVRPRTSERVCNFRQTRRAGWAIVDALPQPRSEAPTSAYSTGTLPRRAILRCMTWSPRQGFL